MSRHHQCRSRVTALTNNMDFCPYQLNMNPETRLTSSSADSLPARMIWFHREGSGRSHATAAVREQLAQRLTPCRPPSRRLAAICAAHTGKCFVASLYAS